MHSYKEVAVQRRNAYETPSSTIVKAPLRVYELNRIEAAQMFMHWDENLLMFRLTLSPPKANLTEPRKLLNPELSNET